jgi:hypothetical protein
MAALPSHFSRGKNPLQLDSSVPVSADFRAGLVLQCSLESPDEVGTLESLVSSARETQGVVRQAVLIRLWALALEHITEATLKRPVKKQVGQAILESVDLHTEALGLTSSLQDALVEATKLWTLRARD